MNTCFVICPIGPEGSDIRKRSDKVFKHIISPVCENQGFKAIRVDMINDTDAINQTIINHLEKAELVISDLSDHNPNAFYETGYRAALGRPLIQLIEEGQVLPFDVSGIRTIFYDLSDLDKVESVKSKLRETIAAVAINVKDDSNAGSDTQIDHAHLQTNTSSQIFSLLLDLKDGFESLKSTIQNKDRSDMEQIISIVISQLQKNIVGPEQKMMEILLPEMLKNPAGFTDLVATIEKVTQTNNKGRM